MTEFVYVCMECITHRDGVYVSDNKNLLVCPTCQFKVVQIGFIRHAEGTHEG